MNLRVILAPGPCQSLYHSNVSVCAAEASTQHSLEAYNRLIYGTFLYSFTFSLSTKWGSVGWERLREAECNRGHNSLSSNEAGSDLVAGEGLLLTFSVGIWDLNFAAGGR